MAPADHGVDGILHGQLQLEGSLGLLFSLEKKEDPSWQVPQGRRLREGALPWAWPSSPAHIGSKKQLVSQGGRGGDMKADRESDLVRRQKREEVTEEGTTWGPGGRCGQK